MKLFPSKYSLTYSTVGEETGPVTEPPPPVPQATKDAIADAAQSSGTGSHVPGQDAGVTKVKSAKELEREKKKAEKQAKFDQKKAKAAPVSGISKTAEKKAKAEKKAAEDVLPPYKEETPEGEKKILKSLDDPYFKAYDPIAVESVSAIFGVKVAMDAAGY